jgi:hypothetical protein
MDEMRELVTEAQAERLVAAFCIGWALAGVIYYLAFARRAGAIGRWRAGFIVLLGPLLYGAWRMYNAIEDHWGLDSVRALEINAAIFVVGGVAIGLAARRLWPPPDAPQATEPEPSPAASHADATPEDSAAEPSSQPAGA